LSSFSYRDTRRDTDDQIIRYAIGDHIKGFKSGSSHRDSNFIHLKEIIEKRFEKQITVISDALKDLSGNTVELRAKELREEIDDLAAKKQSTMKQLDDNFQKYLDLIEDTKRK